MNDFMKCFDLFYHVKRFASDLMLYLDMESKSCAWVLQNFVVRSFIFYQFYQFQKLYLKVS